MTVPYSDPRPGFVYTGQEWVPIIGLKGEPGQSLHLMGSVANASDLQTKTGMKENDAYVADDTGHLWAWSVAANSWLDLGDARGPQGPKGDPGETLKVQGIVPDIASLPTNPPPLDVIVTQDTTTMYVYDPTSAVAIPTGQPGEGWVNMGRVQGPPGEPATIANPVQDVANLPAAGNPGEMRFITSSGHLYGWNEQTQAWVDGGRIALPPVAAAGGGVEAFNFTKDYKRSDIVHYANRLWIASIDMTPGQIPGGKDHIQFDGNGKTVEDITTTMVETDNWQRESMRLPVNYMKRVIVTDYTPARGDWQGHYFMKPYRFINLGDGQRGHLGWYRIIEDAINTNYDIEFDVYNGWYPLGAVRMDQLLDVRLDAGPRTTTKRGLVDGDTLTYNASMAAWVPTTMGGGSLDGLDNVNANGKADGQGLVWEAMSQEWIVADVLIKGQFGIADLADTEVHQPPADGSILRYDATLGKWHEVAFPGLEGVELVEPLIEGDILSVDATGKWVNGQPTTITRFDELDDVDIMSSDPDDVLVVGAGGVITGDKRPTFAEVDAAIRTATDVLVTGLAHDAAVVEITNDPPPNLVEGLFYIVGTAPTGAWVGHADTVAYAQPNVGTGVLEWAFLTPNTGETRLNEDDSNSYTFNGTAWVKIAAVQSSASHVPIGTIIQSVFTEVQFDAAYPTEKVKWRLCDGRSAAGTRYATVTGSQSVPDLRGAFLRMAGTPDAATGRQTWVGGAIRNFFNWATSGPHNPFTTSSAGSHGHTMHNAGEHYHTYNFGGGQGGTWNGPDTGYNSSGNGITGHTDTQSPHQHPIDANGAHTHTITGGGDSETRPTHYTVNYYMRVDD